MKPNFRNDLTTKEVAEYFQYHPETGEFTRLKVDGSNLSSQTRYVGRTTNHQSSKNQYKLLKIKGKDYLAHRLAWLLMTGQWSTDIIDHINRKKNDNRWCNLREATLHSNTFNKDRRSDNKTGIIGVVSTGRPNATNKWKAIIQVDRKQISLGRFPTLEQAAKARQEAEVKYFGALSKTMSDTISNRNA